MSDSEELTILEDIEALQNVLSQPKAVPCTSFEPSTSKIDHDNDDNIHMVVHHSPSYDENYEDYEFHEDNLGIGSESNVKYNEQLKKLLNTNEKLTDTLVEVKEKFQMLLQQCKARQEMIDNKLKTRMKFTPTKHYNWSIAMPYFKTMDCYYAPLNNDAKTKLARGELEIYQLPLSCRWTIRDKTILLEAIRDEIKSKIQITNDDNAGKKVLSAEVKKHIGALGTKEFDWMKIGNSGFQNRHTAEECRVMWNVFLHPDINKTKWNKKEDAMLKTLVKKHNREDWDTIAKELNTKRSAYQCFVRYNANNLKNNMKSTAWTKEEDTRLKRIVDILKVGNYIPWSEVTAYIPERTKQQIYYRWTFNVAPYLKKGRFTAEEDAIFRNALSNYGPNFSRISTFIMPQRTCAQLNDHYNTLHTRETAVKLGHQARWDYKDDIKLLSLYQQFHTNWSRIAKEFENKTRIQVRHRYAAIKRYEERGVSVQNIPRMSVNDETEPDISAVANMEMEIDDIDKELIDHFRGVQITKSKLNSKSKKFFSSQELTENIRKLYNILQLLHANIVQPDCLEQDRLNEKDRQLFHVMGEFCRRSANSVERERIVENYRMAMFGYPVIPRDRYIPPLPFSSLPKPPKGFKKHINSSNTIDYVNLQKETQLKIEYSFPPTPAYVVNEIGGSDADEQFEKMKALCVKENARNEMSLKNKSKLKKIYILSPEVLNKYILKSKHPKGVLVNKINKVVQPVEVEELHDPLNYSYDWLNGSQGIEEDASFLYPLVQPGNRNYARRECVKERLNYIKPNHSLLLCYQTILNYVNNYEKDEHLIERFKVSHKGRVALELLRKRFEILFTYPMCMAKISIPLVVNKINEDLPFWNIKNQKRLQKQQKRKQKRREDEDYDSDEDFEEVE